MTNSGINISTLNKIYTNSLELKEEAEILFTNSRFKRAFFLIYTSLEELEKIIIHLDQKTSFKELTHHNNKLNTAQGILEEVLKNINIEEQKNKLKEIKKTRDEAFKNSPNVDKRLLTLGNEFIEELTERIDALFSTEKISHYRNGSLYISDYDAEKIDPVVYSGLYMYIVIAHEKLVEKIKSKLDNSHTLKRIETFNYLKYKPDKKDSNT